jgi:hypothetical protein
MKTRDKAYEIYATKESGNKRSSKTLFVPEQKIDEALSGLRDQGFDIKTKKTIDRAIYDKKVRDAKAAKNVKAKDRDVRSGEVAYKYKDKFYVAKQGTSPLNADNGTEITEREYNDYKNAVKGGQRAKDAKKYYDPEYDREVSEDVIKKQYEVLKKYNPSMPYEQFRRDNFTEIKKVKDAAVRVGLGNRCFLTGDTGHFQVAQMHPYSEAEYNYAQSSNKKNWTVYNAGKAITKLIGYTPEKVAKEIAKLDDKVRQNIMHDAYAPIKGGGKLVIPERPKANAFKGSYNKVELEALKDYYEKHGKSKAKTFEQFMQQIEAKGDVNRILDLML